MQIGDKVRFKGNDPMLAKGSIGHITNVDWFTDIITIKFDKIVVNCNPHEFNELMELITDVKIPCPVVLKDWFKQTEKYMGRQDD